MTLFIANNVKRSALVLILGLLPWQSQAETNSKINEELTAINDVIQKTLPAGSHLLATCGPSDGRGYYLSPKHSGWADDPISIGRTIFLAGPDGEPNILFQDARGGFVNAVKDGAVVSFSFLDPDKQSFGIIETYPKTGVTQTYAVSLGPDGERVLLWTAIKVHISVADITKVAAFVSKCL